MKSSVILSSLFKKSLPLGGGWWGPLLFLFLLTSCDKNLATQTYSTANPVRCNFEVLKYLELNNTMNSPGEFCTIRQVQRGELNQIEMTSNVGTTRYNFDGVTRYFMFGLGGIIVGLSQTSEPLAYDLACPNCNVQSRRLTIQTDGNCSCPHCHIVYSLNNYGIIVSTKGNTIHPTPRGLYRYRIMWNGTEVSVFN